MVSDLVRDFGLLTLGSRMRRIGERLQADTQRIIEESGLAVQASQYPLLAAIDREGPMTIGELALAVGISQPGITRTVAQLAQQGILQAETSPDDQRRRLIALTQEGSRLVEFSKRNVWPRIRAAVADLCADMGPSLLWQLTALEDGLAEKPLNRRVPKKEFAK